MTGGQGSTSERTIVSPSLSTPRPEASVTRARQTAIHRASSRALRGEPKDPRLYHRTPILRSGDGALSSQLARDAERKQGTDSKTGIAAESRFV